MQTLQYVPKEKQLRIAKETLEIYAPLAYRLGIKSLQRELEDLAFAYVYPKEFDEIKKILKKKKEEVEKHLDNFEKSLKKELAKNGVTEFKMDHRVKSMYSLYKKLEKYKWDVESIYDISALRVTVKEVSDCYRILGIVHGAWRPLPDRIKDYIASPKLNGYRSIHTTIFSGDGGIIEVQIRTEEMHKEAEYGVASHLSYKTRSSKS
jgi:GTP pyrophosphokinase